MYVKANIDMTVPREDNPRSYISVDLIANVESSAYYLRRVAEGSLLEVAEIEWTAQEKKRMDDEEAAIKKAEAEAKAAAKNAKAAAE